ncbi:MAG TPA: hypothetical protein VGP22_04685 [Albitalea sp.]|jgi:hypothetical protein|nr:hypothetical protein [Albitalea sp.]
MVSPVDPSQTIARLAALMQQCAGRGEGPGKAATREMRPGDGAESVAATLREQLRSIAPDHPRRKRALARILVETLLTDEFGNGAVNDAGFQAVVDDVLDSMERVAGVSADLDRVVDALMNTTG